MYIGKVIGTIVSTKKEPCLNNKKLLLVVKLNEAVMEIGEPFVAVDTIQAGTGDKVFIVTSREACLALAEPMNIIDATIVGIVDSVE